VTKNPWKIPLFLLLFGILTIIGVFFKDLGQKQYEPGEVLGQKTNLELFVQPEVGRQPILEAINSAGSEILVEVYLLSDKQIIDSLVEARNRGVKVQIMMEQHPFGGGNVNKNTASFLDQEAMDFKWANPTFALTHEKAMIVDREILFILNQNLTKTAFDKNREYNIIDHNLEEVTEAVNIFEADWNRSGVSPTAANLVVSPENSRGKLTGLINSAQSSIDLEVEIIQDNDMIKLLSDRVKIIPVRMIIPDLGKIPANKDEAMELKNAGVVVRTLKSPYLHAKLILVDQLRAYLGSINLSDASMDQNRELGILISQGDIISKLSETFEKDWERASE